MRTQTSALQPKVCSFSLSIAEISGWKAESCLRFLWEHNRFLSRDTGTEAGKTECDTWAHSLRLGRRIVYFAVNDTLFGTSLSLYLKQGLYHVALLDLFR